jgi:hypothetical protein
MATSSTWGNYLIASCCVSRPKSPSRASSLKSNTIETGGYILRIPGLEAKMSTNKHTKHTPWYFWPFVAIWKLVAGIVALTGRLVAVILGLVLMIVGVVVSLTVVGAIVGVPLAIVGLLLVLRGLF